MIGDPIAVPSHHLGLTVRTSTGRRSTAMLSLSPYATTSRLMSSGPQRRRHGYVGAGLAVAVADRPRQHNCRRANGDLDRGFKVLPILKAPSVV
jgi:hypothetical protein